MNPFETPGSAPRVTEILVVIPARNEEQRLPRCLAALDRASSQLRALARPVQVRVMVVLDSCTDRSAEVLEHWPAFESIRADAGQVGGARAIGIARGLDGSSSSPERIWIACSDADSAVPADWLVTQLKAADAGVDLLLGTVRPDPDELAELALSRWSGLHRIDDGHPHVHGANLGIRADRYLRAGGFQPVAVHEDQLLVATVRRQGGVTVSIGASPVLTSGRLVGRAPEGFAGYLKGLSSAGELMAAVDSG